MTRPPRPCARCGNEFVPPKELGRRPQYCSHACRRAEELRLRKTRPTPAAVARAVPRTCSFCALPFVPRAKWGRPSKYCSPACRLAEEFRLRRVARAERAATRPPRPLPGPRPKKPFKQRTPQTCRRCGALFVPRPGRGRLPRYCSKACKEAVDQERTKVRRAERMAARPPLQRECRECGRAFQWPAWKRPWPRVCSPQCKAIRTRRQQRNTIEIAVCDGCSEEFLRRKGPHSRRLCETCHPPPKRHRAPHTCRTCGVVYLPKSAERITFCSRACSYAFRRSTKLARKDRKTARARKRSFKSCIVCGQIFRSRAGKRRLCSDACRRKRATDAAYRLRTGRDRSEGLRPRPCSGCGQSFNPSRPNARFCSKRCLNRVHRKSPTRRESERRRRRRRREEARRLQATTCTSPPVPAQGTPA